MKKQITEQKYEIARPAGFFLKAIEILTNNGGWIELKKIEKFIEDGVIINSSYLNSRYFFGTLVDGFYHDLSLFKELGDIDVINYIPSLGKQIRLSRRGREMIKEGIIPKEYEKQFYESLSKVRN